MVTNHKIGIYFRQIIVHFITDKMSHCFIDTEKKMRSTLSRKTLFALVKCNEELQWSLTLSFVILSILS